jgi:beta-mannosidase
MEAESNALGMLRMRSSSCNGIVYWPINKGGPCFIFGSIDSAGRPLMAYYAVRRVFADVRIGAYRDVDDVRIVGSNLTDKVISGTLRVAHLTGDGRQVRAWAIAASLQPGNSVRLHDIPRFMDGVRDRISEMVQVTFVADSRVISEDFLYFCPLADYDGGKGQVSVEATRLADRLWRLDIGVDRVARLVEIESSARLLLDDNYFTLVPGVRKSVVVESLDAERPVAVTVAAWDRAVIAEVRLV